MSDSPRKDKASINSEPFPPYDEEDFEPAPSDFTFESYNPQSTVPPSQYEPCYPYRFTVERDESAFQSSYSTVGVEAYLSRFCAPKEVSSPRSLFLPHRSPSPHHPCPPPGAQPLPEISAAPPCPPPPPSLPPGWRPTYPSELPRHEVQPASLDSSKSSANASASASHHTRLERSVNSDYQDSYTPPGSPGDIAEQHTEPASTLFVDSGSSGDEAIFELQSQSQSQSCAFTDMIAAEEQQAKLHCQPSAENRPASEEASTPTDALNGCDAPLRGQLSSLMSLSEHEYSADTVTGSRSVAGHKT